MSVTGLDGCEWTGCWVFVVLSRDAMMLCIKLWWVDVDVHNMVSQSVGDEGGGWMGVALSGYFVPVYICVCRVYEGLCVLCVGSGLSVSVLSVIVFSVCLYDVDCVYLVYLRMLYICISTSQHV